MAFFLISALPDLPISESLITVIGRNNFAIIHRSDIRKSYLWIEDKIGGLADSLALAIPGLELEPAGQLQESIGLKLNAISFYNNSENDVLSDFFALHRRFALIAIVFINVPEREAEQSKKFAESLLSSKGMRATEYGSRSMSGGASIHKELYRDTEEIQMSKEVLFSINDALLKNNLLYKPFLLYDSEMPNIGSYLRDRVSAIAESSIRSKDFPSAVQQLSKLKGFPFGIQYASRFVRGYGARTSRTIKTAGTIGSSNGIPIGKLMNYGVSESVTDVCVEPPTLNLGLLITGLPGSGKTMEAMHIADRIIAQNSRSPTFIIAPSEEWDGFAISHGMNLVRLFSDSLRINFFRCPPMAQKEKFYQDLATVLSSAVGAGPYRRPLEKCLLNAFRKVYEETTNPHPVEVYDAIEDSIILFHGKRTNVGVKYTKHGENIKASLESLRIILNDTCYSSDGGIKFEELSVGGAVFDMSAASSTVKPFLYALVLNQLYSIASEFDTNGDNELRMLICVEEAQIIFKEEDSPAVEDLKQRIQDFRKRGIGLMLTAHNTSDIDLGIRRLCQTRLYMKQAPDSAYLAAKELIFPGVESEVVIDKLKLLSSGVGALSFITRKGREKIQEESVIIKTEPFSPAPLPKFSENKENQPTPTELRLTFGEKYDPKDELRLNYLSEQTHQLSLSDFIRTKLVEGRRYEICLVNEKGRVVSKSTLIGKEKINLFVDKNKVIELIN